MAKVESVLVTGDLGKLTPEERVSYYNRVCESLALNPLTRPFDYLTLQGKTVLYARRDCAEQLRKRDKVSTRITAREVVEGCYVVTASASTPDGRTDESVGAVWIENLAGEPRANAMMKAETKAKRRVTLSICGLGMLDETEVDSFAPKVQHRPPLAIAAETAPQDPSDTATVNAYLELLGECKNRAEAEDVWAKAKIDGKLTPDGQAHVKKIYGTCWKALPKTREAGEDG
jgi:hypothetical protein